MVTVGRILNELEQVAPTRFTLASDRVGLQVGDPEAGVDRGVVSLDRSLAAIDFARSAGAQLLLSHHPLLFHPVGSVDARTYEGRAILALVRANIAFVAAHTNWDAARGGVNDELAARLGLTAVRPFGSAAAVESLKLVVFCPESHADSVYQAVVQAGAGRIGDYAGCAFQSAGTGTFVPGPGAHPAVGRPGCREVVPEVRIETRVEPTNLGAVVAALRAAHPYEEPAFDLVPLAPNREQPLGRLGQIPSTSLGTLAEKVRSSLGSPTSTWGDPASPISVLAVCGGAADGEWVAAREAGAEALVTGEARQHVVLEASEAGFPIIAAGHYATEHPGVEALARTLALRLPEVDWQVYAPDAGFAGRPF